MDRTNIEKLQWLTELIEQVEREVETLLKHAPTLEHELKREHELLLQQRKGWALSLSDPELPLEVRSVLQDELKTAEARRMVIEQKMAANAAYGARAGVTVDRDEVLRRLRRLPELLGTEATIANLELSKVIDRIECFPDGRVSVRVCKLGLLPELMELMANDGNPTTAEPPSDSAMTGPGRGSSNNVPRRRSRLRVIDDDEGDASTLEADIEFATDTNRFVGLDDAWFWVDEFMVPQRGYWIDQHHQAVKTRYSELEHSTGKKPTVAELARLFGKSEPTIRKALAMPVEGNERAATDGRRRGGYTPPLTADTKQEVVRRYEAGEVE